ncbi:hypothetical protein [Yoonia maritima]|uniref:hypothetical protein n=1 Tax=Yoonia maritima TaxID=1435347 RepID=UPI000D0E7299|nr:hypothetical protein [Yoonia maritima]
MSEHSARLAELAQATAADPMPDDLANWLTHLENLVGVPFNYLLPDSKMLPPETLRQFHIDPNWINALIDGAMSIGRHFESQNALGLAQQAEHANLLSARSQTAEMKQMLRQTQLSQIPKRELPARAYAKMQKMCSTQGVATPVALAQAPVMTGFLLRSKVVRGWPSMDVAGYPSGASPYDNNLNSKVKVVPLDIVRLVQLSDDVLFGIFKGELFELVFHQPAEAIHCGFDQINPTASPPNVIKDLRYPTAGWQQEKSPYNSLSQKQMDNAFHDPSERVLNMAAISEWMATTLKKDGTAPGYYQAAGAGNTPPPEPYIDHLVSSDFGMEMVQGVGLVSFINKQAPAAKS